MVKPKSSSLSPPLSSSLPCALLALTCGGFAACGGDPIATDGRPAAVPAASPLVAERHDRRDVNRVLLISVDGLHQSDLAWWVAGHPASTLAGLVGACHLGWHTESDGDSHSESLTDRRHEHG